MKHNKILNLRGKNLADEGIKNFSFNNCINITELDLRENKITDIKILKRVQFNKFEKLNLRGNKISNINIFENINFKELKEIALSNKNIAEITVLERLKIKFRNINILA